MFFKLYLPTASGISLCYHARTGPGTHPVFSMFSGFSIQIYRTLLFLSIGYTVCIQKCEFHRQTLYEKRWPAKYMKRYSLYRLDIFMQDCGLYTQCSTKNWCSLHLCSSLYVSLKMRQEIAATKSGLGLAQEHLKDIDEKLKKAVK